MLFGQVIEPLHYSTMFHRKLLINVHSGGYMEIESEDLGVATMCCNTYHNQNASQNILPNMQYILEPM